MNTKTSFLRSTRPWSIVMGLLVLFACAKQEDLPDKKKNVKSVQTALAETKTVRRMLNITGSVEPVQIANLASPAQGPVRDLKVREGDKVSAGQILLSIGRTEGITALVSSLQEELKKEEDNLRRTEQLVQKGAIPGEQLDQARAMYEKVKAQLINARETVLDYSISAPWNGTISQLHVRDGDFVVPRAPLLEMYDPATLVIRAAVPEQYAITIDRNMPLQVTLDAYGHQKFSAEIFRIYPFLDQQTRTRTIEVKVKEIQILLPGMFARLEIVLEQIENATVVPAKAVVISPNGMPVIFTVTEGMAKVHKVVLGVEEGTMVQVVSGIEPGDNVVIAGNEGLKDGNPVKGPAGSDNKSGPGTDKIKDSVK